MKLAALLSIGLGMLGAGGCATARHQPQQTATVRASVTSKPAADDPGTFALAKAPEPVYRNPKIGVVYLRSYVDAQGRLLGPQVMYQVTDSGGWNVEAVDQGNGFIPAANVEIPPALGSPFAAPARQAKAAPPDQPLLDPSAAAHIVMTGLMRQEDQGQAEAMARQAGAGFSAVFDSEAGWLLLPPGRSSASP